MSAEKIKKQIFDLVRQYHQEVFEIDKETKKELTYIPPSGKKLGVEELVNMVDASLDMWLTAGRFNDEFENKFAKKLGSKYALSVNSGSSANLLALSALTSHKLGNKALKKGDEVITVAAAFPTTVNPIIQNGLVPVFVDCDPLSYNIKIDEIEQALSPKTKAIFIAHTLGHMYDMDRICAICEKHSLWLIEDSCDALGAKFSNKYAGSIGHIGTFSFYPAHHMTMGEGGAVITNDSNLYRILMSFRDWGRDCWCKPGQDNSCNKRFSYQLGKLPQGYDHKYTYSHIGYNLKITDWQAAIGLAQLEKLDSFIEKRTNNAQFLIDKLADLNKWLILPSIEQKEQNSHTTNDLRDNSKGASWFGFLISVKTDAPFTKQELVEYLEQNNIGTRQLFAGNILRQPMFTEYDIDMRIGNSKILNSRDLTEEHFASLPGTEFIMNNTFWVGCYPGLGETELRKTSDILHEFLSKYI